MKTVVLSLCTLITLGLASAIELPGESCSSAIVISSLPYCDQGNTADYINNFDDDILQCPIYTLGGKDVAYAYTPATTQVVSASTCGTTAFLSYLHVYTGCETGLQQVACNINGCPNDAGACISNLTLNAGTTYYFVVDSEDNRLGIDEGPYNFALQEGSVCPECDEILPVELISFTAMSQNRLVTLQWSTAAEQNSDHYEIVRNGIVRGRVDAAGFSSSTRSYVWVDDEVQNDLTYDYTLYLVDLDGSRESLGMVQATPAYDAFAVKDYALHQNYPNPFNPTTSITVDLADAGIATLKVYNLLGQEVRSLINEYMPRGSHTVLFNGTNLPSGVYVYQLSANGYTAQRKMVLMK